MAEASQSDPQGDTEYGPGPLVLGPGMSGLRPGEVPHVPQSRYEFTYLVLAGTFVAMLVLTNIIGTKLFALPLDLPVIGGLLRLVDRFNVWAFDVPGGGTSLTLTAGIITYPITFLLTDIVSETWGRRRADVMVLLGFGASLLMLSTLAIATRLSPAEVWKIPADYAHVLAPAFTETSGGVIQGTAEAAQAAYSFTFDAPGTLLFASMTAYLVAQLVDNRLFHFWRRLTRGRALWFRNNMSTGVSQLVDTIIVNGIFLHFYWKLPAATIASVIMSVYVVKFLLALLDTPFCYLGVWLAQRSVPASLRPGGPS
jgi:uncharacterized PurR-regulated membrane protein YhhQ (DUF165 family)